MELKEFEYHVTAHIAISQEETDLLIEVALTHYDNKCQQAVLPGPGAFLNGWKHRLGFVGEGPNTVPVTFRELDTCMKILEMAHFRFTGQGQKQELASKLSGEVWCLLQKINDEYKRVNSVNPDPQTEG
jgi:hypothetical protein